MTYSTPITRFFNFAAPAYDQQCLQRWMYRPAQDEVLDTLRPRTVGRVADVACGTGILTDRIERKLDVDEVYGVDLSEGMLAQARKRSNRVQWSIGRAEELPFEDGFLDAVVTTTAFHFFDQPAALREFHRVLAPGGVAVVTAMVPHLQVPGQSLLAGLRIPSGSASARELRTLFEAAELHVIDQHRVRRPLVTKLASDMITVATKE